ncbi:hypothetical protein [Rhizobium sp. AAP43]|nr:hypothetical protein [Rhizobium sp. AAP43]
MHEHIAEKPEPIAALQRLLLDLNGALNLHRRRHLPSNTENLDNRKYEY